MNKREKAVGMVGLAVLGILTLTACNEVVKFKERLKLTDAQVTRAQPIIETYIQNQDKIFDELKAKMSAGGPGGSGGPGSGMGGPGGGGGSADFGGGPGGSSSSGRPDMSAMKKEMEEKKKELDAKFQDNDAWAMKQLSDFISAEQLAEFPKVAEELRQAKFKEMMSSGPGGGPGGGGMGGPGGGGMGGPGGGGMGGPGGGGMGGGY